VRTGERECARDAGSTGREKRVVGRSKCRKKERERDKRDRETERQRDRETERQGGKEGKVKRKSAQ